ncbi:cysteine desulfurase NifS [Candidatus Uhrbacteria bacterium RIFCSPHIGHO2_12_FULL_60_25]|uniref:Cysteine desulfurase NifS n=1 Tax=Candidatus Uhrbacteria bacterium RIFCSPHIGHO2_12_FULL_60_25 TaxID=1802399 RepID=A0A1F7UJ36_9BACT|nr:MAG: cysteine desulfurase NifS [Candidatus Uhrbacteria bacterium RIFCSPHIGHO2_12_FULL_60_25]
MKPIYLDHAATTPLDPRVLEAMRPFFSETFANPSSFHTPGLRAKEAVAAARQSIAKHLNGREDEIIFTSGGTESDNLAVVGVVRALKTKGKHVVTSSIEHHAVLEPLLHLKKTGEIDLTILPVDKYGLVSVADLVVALRPDTVLVSIMYANNEIGTIEPIADIGRAILKWRKDNVTHFPYFHTDACQAAGVLDMDVEKLHVDLLTLNASKMYGPKGIGVLFVRRAVKIETLIRGGGQEKNIRSGTENVPGIVGLATALDLSQAEKDVENARLTRLRDRLIAGLLAIPKTRLNGHPTERLPNNVNISFIDIEGEAAVLYLDAEGIYTSTGSACASTSLDPSHVILATGLSYEAAHGSLRFTLGRSTTPEDVERVIAVMPGVVEKLRHMSPVNLDMKYFN